MLELTDEAVDEVLVGQEVRRRQPDVAARAVDRRDVAAAAVPGARPPRGAGAADIIW